MTLHLAASFSRDAALLGLAFLFTALCLQAVFGGEGKPMPARRLAALAVCGVLLAPAKVVYLPLAALFWLIPAVRMGARPWLKKGLYAAACLALALALNGAMLAGSLTSAAPETAAQPAAAETAAVSAAAPAGKAAPEPPRRKPPGRRRPMGPPISTPSRRSCLPARRRLLCGGCTTVWNAAPTYRTARVAFWVQALADGDVTAALLGQSFFFSPAEMETPSLSDDDFIRARRVCLP